MAKTAPVDTADSVRTLAVAAVLIAVFSISAYAQSAPRNTLRGAAGSGSVQQAAGDYWAKWPTAGLSYRDSEWSAHWFLKNLGCEQGAIAFLTRLFFHPVGFIFFVLALMLAAWFAKLKLAKHNFRLKLGSGVLAASVLLAVFQWHASLEQEAMQRYEVEISNANNAETSRAVALMLPDLYTGSDSDHAQEHFVYIHLDNLEYALERYREGFASATTTARAIMTFAVHCREPLFREHASEQMKGYSPLVQRVARAVIARI
jgi:hypothetical protein